MRPAYEGITTPNHDFTEACVDSGFVRFGMQVVFLAGAASLAFGASAAAVAPKPVAGRCAYSLGVILRPPGLVDVYKYRFTGGRLQQWTQLATATRAGGTISTACTRVKALTPPARTLGLAGPWPLRTESRIYCPAGGTIQIRPIVARGRVVGTRLLVMRKDAATPSIHVLDGRHPIVDVSLRAKGGGISFDPAYCDRTSIT